MIKPPPLDELVNKVSDILPSGMDDLGEQSKSQLKSVLSRWLQEMDFVTREEFEIQKAVLQKTRLKLDELSKRLDEIESEKD